MDPFCDLCSTMLDPDEKAGVRLPDHSDGRPRTVLTVCDRQSCLQKADSRMKAGDVYGFRSFERDY